MKQQINLLSADLLPPREWLGFNLFVAIVGGVALTLALLSGAQGARAAYTRSAISAMHREVGALLARNESVRVRRENDPALRALTGAIAALAAERRSNERLLTLVGNGHNARATGFATYFEALARSHVDGLWLNKVVIDADAHNIDLAGEARAPDQVPAWLIRLRDSSAFAKSIFSGLALTYVPADDNVGFSVRGTP